MTSSVGALSCFITARFLILPSLSSDSIHHFSWTSLSRLLLGTGTDSPALSSSGTIGSTPPTCSGCEYQRMICRLWEAVLLTSASAERVAFCAAVMLALTNSWTVSVVSR